MVLDFTFVYLPAVVIIKGWAKSFECGQSKIDELGTILATCGRKSIANSFMHYAFCMKMTCAFM